MPVHAGAAGPGRHLHAEPGDQFPQAQGAQPDGREFQGERDPGQPLADRDDVGLAVLVKREPGIDGRGPLGEQVRGVALGQVAL